MRRASLTGLFVLLLAVSGCSSDISKSHEFDTASGEALVLVGVQSQSSVNSYSVMIQRFDPATKQVDRPGIYAFAQGGFWGIATATQFTAVELPPGIYTIVSVRTETGAYPANSVFETCLSRGSAYYVVEAGQVNYLGDLEVDYGGVTFVGHDVEGAQAFMADFDNVTAPLLPVKGNKATFQPC